MKKGVIVLVIVAVLIVTFSINYSITGNVVGGSPEGAVDSGAMGGPTAEDSACLYQCVMGEGKAESVCMTECGVAPEPEPADDGEACMQECIVRGCDDEKDFTCQRANLALCDDECGMKGDAPDESEMSEEQLCILNCVNAEDPSVICGSGTEEGMGETGNALCQRCAKSCEYLYSGPCLTDELWREKEDDCMATGEHMEAAPVRGASGQGYECTVNIECIDRSGEFGDDAGTGDDNWEDYDATLDLSGSEGTFLIEDNQADRKIEIEIGVDEDVSLEQRGEKLIVKNDEVEVEIDNNIDSLVISEKGNRRDIDNIDIGIEEGKPIYKYEEKERARLLGFIPVGKDVKKKVDAENIEVLEEDGPWWEFLSTEVKK